MCTLPRPLVQKIMSEGEAHVSSLPQQQLQGKGADRSNSATDLHPAGVAGPPAEKGGMANPPAEKGGVADPPAEKGGVADPPAEKGGVADPPAGEKVQCKGHPVRKGQKRRRQHSSESGVQEGEGRGGGGRGHHGGSGGKRGRWAAVTTSSSKSAANKIMKRRLGGSVSDPLNLEGVVARELDQCSTCAPSPAAAPGGDQPSLLLPSSLTHDPLNLEGKVKNFPAVLRPHDRPREGRRGWRGHKRTASASDKGKQTLAVSCVLQCTSP